MLTFMGFHQPRDGYGYSTIKLAQAFERMGARPGGQEVRVVDMREDADVGRWEVEGDAIAFCNPMWLDGIRCSGRLAAVTMFEATRLPSGWVERLNAVDRIVTPSAWCQGVFERNGVTTPIMVVGLGVDPEDYPLLDRSDHDGRPYTFLWSGTPDRRKGWDVAYRAFWRAFAGSDAARLVMHFRGMPRGVTGFSDANVEVVEGSLTLEEVRGLLQRADCYVFPSRGEGWGLPPREAAATGLPVIATDHGGLAEEIDRWALRLPVRGYSRADFGFWEEDLGEWAEPHLEMLVAWLRVCRECPAAAAERGRRAAAWLREHATWEQTATQLLEALDGW
jgi:glycosyltransferase involved in cell wall biosynthesis